MTHTAHRARNGELDDAHVFRSVLATGDPLHGVAFAGCRFDISTPGGYVAAWRRFANGRSTWTSR